MSLTFRMTWNSAPAVSWTSRVSIASAVSAGTSGPFATQPATDRRAAAVMVACRHCMASTSS